MRGRIVHTLLLSATLFCAGLVHGADPEPLPCGPPCPPPKVVTAPPQNIVVEVPPPNITIQQSAVQPAVCTEHGGLLSRCCHRCRVPVYMQPSPMAVSSGFAVQPMAVQPMAVQSMAVQSMAVQPYSVAPAASAASFAVQPYSVAPAPVASYAVQPYSVAPAPAASFAVQPVSLGVAPAATSLAVQPMAVQSLGVAPAPAASLSIQSLSIAPSAMAAPPAAYGLVVPVTPSATAEREKAASAEAATPAGMEFNQALKKMTIQISVLTKALDAHTDLLTNHELRLNRLEKLAKDNLLKGKDLPDLGKLPGQ